MKIAAITITQNDGYKFKEWCEHYEEYKGVLYKHIIVDNNSDPAYLQQVKEFFSDSIIIERPTNGGCTGAYNDGIKEALKDDKVDSIMLVGNDIRISDEGVKNLYRFLFSNEEFGMVSPVLLSPNSNIIECFGSKLNLLGIDKRPYVGLPSDDSSLPSYREAEYVTGGMSLSKREFYETVGLQDENLFMYADELDMGYRAKKAGFKEAVTNSCVAYHCHINPEGKSTRRPVMYYLHGRNIVYLYKKHLNPFSSALRCIIRLVMATIPVILHPFNRDQRLIFKQFCRGFNAGLKNNMDNSMVSN